MPDICAVINLHAEGLLAHASLRSAIHAKKVAEENGITVEILAVADCADHHTKAQLDVFKQFGARVLEVEHADLGLSRNTAVMATTASYIAFLDADDLWAPNWLQAAFHAAEGKRRDVVWHPEVNLYFGPEGCEHWFQHPDMDEAGFEKGYLGLTNLWTALCFASRRIFLDTPYRPTDFSSGFGYEDWSWNATTIANGVVHKTVPGTAHLIRRKPVSLAQRTASSAALMIPSPLFRNIWAAGQVPGEEVSAACPSPAGRWQPRLAQRAEC